MGRSFTVAAARTEELAPALRFLFRHLDEAERDTRLANTLHLIQTGELDPAGVVIARDRTGMIGALVCLPVAGASGLFWPPQTVGGSRSPEIEDALVQHAVAWLRGRGVKLGQAMLFADETYLAVPLERNGFAHVGRLWYLRHDLELPFDLLAAEDPFVYQSYEAADRDQFHATLLRTYEGTLDCPELNGVRSLAEILAGHRAQGEHDPQRWWLARDGDQPAGVLLTTLLPESGAWEVAYVGVAPERRRRGLGRCLMIKALLEARAAEASYVTLSVDERNQPAWNLYQRLGFERVEQREVYLAIWNTDKESAAAP
jgi:ribosomal protein S18 acetylase RimI-like enzyme